MTTKTTSERLPRIRFTSPAGIKCQRDGEGSSPPTFEMTAYTGGVMYLNGFFGPVVVDLAGMQGLEKSRPILKDHSPSLIVGHTNSVRVEDGQLLASGVISASSNVARDVVELSKNGFPWQASIGGDPLEIEEVPAGMTAEANGREFTGPVTIVTKSLLREVSLVAVGADDDTSTSIAAEAAGATPMSTKETETPESTPEEPKASEAAESAGATAIAPPIEASGREHIKAMRQETAAEMERHASIRKIAAKDPEIAAEAIREGWSPEQTENRVLKAQIAKHESESMTAPNIHAHGGEDKPSGPVLEAAFALAAGVKKPEDHYDAKTLEAADKRYPRKLKLGQMLLELAAQAGHRERAYRIDDANGPQILKAAFSNREIAGILSNVGNKMVMESFNRTEQAWREIAPVRSVSDFKTVTTYRLTGDVAYEKMAAGTKIQHGTMGEAAYTNKADTYAKMAGLTREDIINDDAGALGSAMRRLGVGANQKLNQVFWSTFMNNGSFFTSGRNNYFAGATSALSVTSLAKAEQMFRDQKNEEGQPLGYDPEILLVPTALDFAARQLFESAPLITGSDVTVPSANPLAGLYRPVMSRYLGNTEYDGASSTAFYLLGNKDDLPVIQVVALNGRAEPTVEMSDAMFDELGILFRGYHDFGVALMEYRGGVKSKGAA